MLLNGNGSMEWMAQRERQWQNSSVMLETRHNIKKSAVVVLPCK